ncbi:MAG: hypothetical protein HRU07_07800 [Nitrosopumilus sp.]|nr:hypothetical protein [Nitrosopumilus sp.]NRA06041.1 hypothetical protein [Nitrosopumilus sp.]
MVIDFSNIGNYAGILALFLTVLGIIVKLKSSRTNINRKNRSLRNLHKPVENLSALSDWLEEKPPFDFRFILQYTNQYVEPFRRAVEIQYDYLPENILDTYEKIIVLIENWSMYGENFVELGDKNYDQLVNCCNDLDKECKTLQTLIDLKIINHNKTLIQRFKCLLSKTKQCGHGSIRNS